MGSSHSTAHRQCSPLSAEAITRTSHELLCGWTEPSNMVLPQLRPASDPRSKPPSSFMYMGQGSFRQRLAVGDLVANHSTCLLCTQHLGASPLPRSTFTSSHLLESLNEPLEMMGRIAEESSCIDCGSRCTVVSFLLLRKCLSFPTSPRVTAAPCACSLHDGLLLRAPSFSRKPGSSVRIREPEDADGGRDSVAGST